MIFSLDLVSDDSELNLASSTPYLPTVLGSSEFPLGNEFCYQFCEQISQVCGNFQLIPETQSLVLDYNGFCQLVSKSDTIITNLSTDLGITRMSALEQTQLFFQDKNIVVQAAGVQGAFYKIGSFLQLGGSAGLVTQTLALAKLAGVNGIEILKAQPALAIALPTISAMFFYGCTALTGNNTVGKVLVTIGDVLALPMKGFETFWNRYANPVSLKLFGMPMILNMTQTFKTGPGYTIKEIRDYIPLNNNSFVNYIKKKMINWLSS